MNASISLLGNCFWAPKRAPKKSSAFISTARPLSILDFPRLLSRLIATRKAFFKLNENIKLMERLERTLEQRGVISYALLEEHGFGYVEIFSDDYKGAVGIWANEGDKKDESVFYEGFDQLTTLDQNKQTIIKPEYRIAFINLIGIKLKGVDNENIDSIIDGIERHSPKSKGIRRIKSGDGYDLIDTANHTLVIAVPKK